MPLVSLAMQFFSLSLRKIALVLGAGMGVASAQEKPAPESEESKAFAEYARKLREAALADLSPRVVLPASARSAQVAFKWKSDIITTVFHVGGKNGEQSSAWDPRWRESFGGDDPADPAARLTGPEYRPKEFVPQLNPFYCALPYNDVLGEETKAKARTAIPWFRETFTTEGQSVCRDRWVAIRNRRNARIAYAQWSDVGPYRTDRWEYVFGTAQAMPGRPKLAGFSVSPSVRDFLGIGAQDVTDWRFVEVRDVPPGPWRKYGTNNPFANGTRVDLATPAPKIPIANPEIVPTVRPR